MARRQRFMGLGTTVEPGGGATFREAGGPATQPVLLDAPSHLFITIVGASKSRIDPDVLLITSSKTGSALAWLKGALNVARQMDPSSYSAFIKSYPLFDDPNLSAEAKIVGIQQGANASVSVRLFVYGRNGNPIPFGAARALNDLLAQTYLLRNRSGSIQWFSVATTNVAGDGTSINVVTPTPDSIQPALPKPPVPQPVNLGSSALGIFLVVGTVMASVWAWKKVFK
jgi:hypothetical protein